MLDNTCFPTNDLKSRLSNVSPEVRRDAVGGFSILFTDRLYKNGYNVNHAIEAEDLTDMLNKTWEDFSDILRDPINQIIEEYKITSGEELTKALNEIPELFKYRSNKLILEQKEGFFNDFISYLNKIGLKAEYKISDDALTEEVTNRENDPVDRNGIIEPFSTNPREDIKNNVKLAISTLAKEHYIGDFIKEDESSLELPVPIDYDKALRTIINTVKGSVSLEEMMEKLDNKFYNPLTRRYVDGYLWLKGLKSRLGIANDRGKYVKTRDLSEDDLKLITAFEASFSKMAPEPVKLMLANDNENNSFNPIDYSSTRDITTQWKNNIKYAINQAELNNSSKDKLFKYNQGMSELDIARNSKEYKQFTDTYDITANESVENLDNILNKLKLVGIDFKKSSNDLLFKNTLISNGRSESNFKIIKDSYEKIVDALKSTHKIGGTNETPVVRTFDELFDSDLGVAGRILNLSKVHNSVNPEEYSMNMLTPEGELMYPMSYPSTFGITVDNIYNARTIAQLYKASPWLAKSPYFNPDRSAFIKLLFETKIRPYENRKFKAALILGVGMDEEDEGISSKKLSLNDSIVQDFNNILNNYYMAGINSDKSTYPGLGTHRPLMTMKDIQEKNKITERWISMLRDEMDAAINEIVNPSRVFNYQDQVTKLGYCRNILNKNAIESFVKSVLFSEIDTSNSDSNKWKVKRGEVNDISNYEKAAHKWIKDNYVNLDKLIQSYIDRVSENYLQKHLIDKGIVIKTEETSGAWKYKLNGITRSLVKSLLGEVDMNNLSHSNMMDLVRFVNINNEICRNELHKLIFGNICYYKDPAKRYSMWHGMKQIMSQDQDVIKRLDQLYPRTDLRGKTSDEEQYVKNDRFLRLITYKEPLFIQEGHEDLAETFHKDGIKPELIGAEFTEDGKYKNLILKNGKPTGLVGKYILSKEADSITKMIFDHYWNYRMRIGDMSRDDWELYKYDRAYEIYHLGSKSEQSGDKFNYPQKWIDEAKELIDSYDRVPNAPQTIVKFQYTGWSKKGHPVGLKSAGEYICYRTVKGTWLEKAYLESKKKGLDLIGFESGQKFGAITDENGEFTPIYGEDGEWSGQIPDHQELYSFGMGKQTEFPASKEEVKGSQQGKQSLANCKDEETKAEYNKAKGEVIKQATKEFLEEAGVDQDESGKYFTKDAANMVTRLRTSLIKAGMPTDQIESIATSINSSGNKGIKIPFDLMVAKNAIEHMLWRNINSDIVNRKQFGVPYKQTPMLGVLDEPLKLGYLDKDTKKVVYVDNPSSLSDDLKKQLVIIRSKDNMQRIKDGKVTPAKYIPGWPYKSLGHPSDFGLIQGKDGLWRDEKDKLDPKLLNLVSFRIPTPGRNSISHGEVIAFHDPSAGDIISSYASEYVRNDSDNDGDTLQSIFYNIQFGGFKNFMLNHLKESGYEDPESIYNSIDKAGYDRLNKAAWTEKGKDFHKVADSIEALGSSNEDFKQVLSTIKKGIQAYKSSKKSVLEPIYDNSIEGLQNKVLDLQIKLLENTDNYGNLMAPITTGNVGAHADYIKKKQGIDDKESDYTSINQLGPSQDLRNIFLTSKNMIGTLARTAAQNVMCQSVGGVRLDKTWDAKGVYFLSFPTKKEIVPGNLDSKEVKIIFPHNTNPEGYLYYGAFSDAEGNDIGNNISNSVQATLEAGKDPSIAYVGLNKITVATGMHLTQLGVPERYIHFFLAQPIIKDFVTEMSSDSSILNKVTGKQIFRPGVSFKVFSKYLDNGNSYKQWQSAKWFDKKLPEAYIEQERKKGRDISPIIPGKNTIKRDFLDRVNEIVSDYDKVSIEDLANALDTKSTDSKEKRELQIALLYRYLEYEDQARKTFNFTQYINYDTANVKTLAENLLRNNYEEKVKNDKLILDYKKVVEKTFLNEIKIAVENMDDKLGDYFAGSVNRISSTLKEIMKKVNSGDIFMMPEDKKNILNQYQNHILNWLIQTLPDENGGLLYSKAGDMIFGNNSFAKDLAKFRGRFPEDIALQNLQPLIDQSRNGSDSMRMVKSGTSTYDLDQIVDSLINSWKLSKDPEYKQFISKLATYSLIQSGLQNSRNSIQRIIPQEIYLDAVKHLLNFKNSNISDVEWNSMKDIIYKQFHQNFYKSKLVKILKKNDFTSEGDNIISVDKENDAANYDFLRQSIKAERGNKAEINRRAGMADKNYIHNLYQIINEDLGDPDKLYYRKINIKGKYGIHVEVSPNLFDQSIHDSNKPFDENSKSTLDKIEELKGNTIPKDSFLPDENTIYNDKTSENIDKLGFQEGPCK